MTISKSTIRAVDYIKEHKSAGIDEIIRGIGYTGARENLMSCLAMYQEHHGQIYRERVSDRQGQRWGYHPPPKWEPRWRPSGPLDTRILGRRIIPVR
jgi:hypothetical protein